MADAPVRAIPPNNPKGSVYPRRECVGVLHYYPKKKKRTIKRRGNGRSSRRIVCSHPENVKEGYFDVYGENKFIGVLGIRRDSLESMAPSSLLVPPVRCVELSRDDLWIYGFLKKKMKYGVMHWYRNWISMGILVFRVFLFLQLTSRWPRLSQIWSQNWV